ncbi:helix-turn-helix domain-containing protein [Listeria newyorkensis]|uniref:helix-turn-helix domain-containing protein n=1 Tax=Listeria newyorkensis TaxID=1497681 RepID=UPI0014857246|nr:helix-turn-helix domain-containing protein [Listeria newyorkensis]
MLNFKNLFKMDKKFLREVKLGRCLLEKSGYCSVSYLSEQLHCTEKTTRTTLKSLSIHIPAGWQLVESKNVGIRLDKPPHITNRSIFNTLVQGTLTYQIIHSLYTESYERVADLAADLFISVPLLYRYLAHIQSELAQCHLFLNKKPLRLHGDESNIRAFYYHFFYDLTADSHNINSAHQELLNDCITFINQLRGTKPTKNELRVDHFSLGIMLHRISRGHYLTMEPQLLTSSSNFLATTLLKEKIEYGLCISLPTDELQWLSYILFELGKRNHDTKTALLQHPEFNKLVHNISLASQFELTHDTTFKQILANQITYANGRIDWQLVTSKSVVLEEYFEQNQAELYANISQLYKAFDDESSLFKICSPENILEIMFYLADINKSITKKVCLLTSKGKAWERFVSDIITAKIDLQLVILNSMTEDADILITDYSIDNPKIPTVAISLFPTEKDIAAIDFILTKRQK